MSEQAAKLFHSKLTFAGIKANRLNNEVHFETPQHADKWQAYADATLKEHPGHTYVSLPLNMGVRFKPVVRGKTQ